MGLLWTVMFEARKRNLILHFWLANSWLLVVSACSGKICLEWKISEQNLILKCKIRGAKHLVSIYDQTMTLQGDCFPSHPTNPQACSSLRQGGHMYRLKESMDFIFELINITDKDISGEWSCRHGSRIDVAFATVNLTGTTQVVVTTSKHATDTNYHSHATTGDTMNTHYDAVLQFLKEYLKYILPGLAFLFIASMIITAVISRRCKGRWNPRTEVQNITQLEVISLSRCSSDDDVSPNYDIINEQEMLSEIKLRRIEIDRQFDILSSKRWKSLTAPENLYLDVVDSDHMIEANSYQELHGFVPQVEIHTYSTLKKMFRRNTL